MNGLGILCDVPVNHKHQVEQGEHRYVIVKDHGNRLDMMIF